MRSRVYWIACLVCIIGLGIASRFSLVWQMSTLRKALLAMLIMTALEVFQLTMIPALGVFVIDRVSNYGRR
jgi:hypothetical protein